MESTGFHIADYVVLTVLLLLSLGIGIYYAFSGGRQKSKEEYLVGDRNMSVLPVAMSLFASGMSAIGMLGLTTESTVYSAIFLLFSVGQCFSVIFSAFVIIPLLHPLKLITINEVSQYHAGHTILL